MKSEIISSIIKDNPVLPHSEQVSLIKKWQDDNDKNALDSLILSNMRIVSKECFKACSKNKNILYEDVLQEGIAGLLKAVEKFDLSRQNNFLTYAMWWVKAYIGRYIMDQKSIVRMGKNAEERSVFSSLSKAEKEVCEDDLNRDAKISKMLGVKRNTLVSMRQRLSAPDQSLDELVFEDGPRKISRLTDSGFGSLKMSEKIYLERLNDILNDIMSKLPDKERIVLERRFLTNESKSLREVGEELSMTKEGIRIVEKRALLKVKKVLSSKYNINTI